MRLVHGVHARREADKPLASTPQIIESVRLLVGEVRKLGQIVGVLRAPPDTPLLRSA